MPRESISAILEGLSSQVVEATKKLTKKDVLAIVKKQRFILLDGGENKFTVVKMNTSACDMSASFEDQLKQSKMYDRYYAAVIIPSNMDKCSMDYLPIYGSSREWVNKWLFSSFDDAANSMLSSRQIGIVSRANAYLEKNPVQEDFTESPDASLNNQLKKVITTD